MQVREVLDRLQDLTNEKISQQSLANALSVRQGAISNRITRNVAFSIEELMKIERAFSLPMGVLAGVNLPQNNTDCVDLDFYPDVFGSCGSGCMVFNETSEKLALSSVMAFTATMPANTPFEQVTSPSLSAFVITALPL